VDVTIEREAPDSPDGRALVSELDAVLNPLYAPEDRHGYDIARLLQPGVEFFVARVNGAAAGCGAVHHLSSTGSDVAYGEVKRMFVRPGFRGLGLGRRILDRLVDRVREAGAGVVRLETGVHQHEAIGLYESAGFREIPPFGSYPGAAVSRCYELRLEARQTRDE